MRHLLKYTFLSRVKRFEIVFWPFLFPLALTTLMYFGIGKMEETDFETIPVAVVSEEAGTFSVYLKEMESAGNMIRVEEMTEDEALKALENKKVEGIYFAGEETTLTVSRNGLAQSILQMILESYEEGRQTMEDVARLRPEGMQAAAAKMSDFRGAVEQVSLGGRTTNTTAQFFYALIGMACLYGCFIGFGSAMELQANGSRREKVRGSGTPDEADTVSSYRGFHTAFCEHGCPALLYEIHLGTAVYRLFY